jgi:CBS domain-containing protein
MNRTVADLLRNGGVIVYTSPEASVSEAAQRMSRHNVGSILVLDARHQLVGIFTERDLLQRVVVARRDPDATPIREVMTKDVIVVPSSTPRGDVLSLMQQQHIRHIPVADDEKLLGVISLRDVLRFENQEKEFEIEQLKGYLLHKPYPVYPA